MDPNYKSAVHKLLQSAESKINVLNKKLKLPTREHPMAAKVAEVENEKEYFTAVVAEIGRDFQIRVCT